MFFMIFVITAFFLLFGYIFYGRFLEKVFGISNDNITPAERLNDGADYCPTHPAVLLGHHFSSVAGPGPVVGPITAASIFGWLPAVIWCIIGSIFIGGPHDFGSLVSSMRHDGKSIGEVIGRWISPRARQLLIFFTLLSLVLICTVSLVLTAQTFINDPVVAFVSCLYIVLALISGILIYRFNVNIAAVTIVMLAIIAACTAYGDDMPFVAAYFTHSVHWWYFFLVIYIVFAAILPVWLLLQPRDYLASYFLYFSAAVGAIGMILGSAFNSGKVPAIAPAADFFGLGKVSLWPMLFIIIACGAVSGFHSVVGSGTTSKQIAKEKHALPIAYGSMLLECLVAVISIGTFMAVGGLNSGGPVETFAAGFGKFCTIIGISPKIGMRIGAIAINCFMLTSLDTDVRLARYQIQELSNYRLNKYIAALAPIAASLALAYTKTSGADGNPVPVWTVIWPIFGAANQLIAALAILAIAIWIIRGLKKNGTFLMIPFWFMIVTSLAGFVVYIKDAFIGENPSYLIVAICIVLFIIGLFITLEGIKAIKRDKDSAK
ncbi:MAG: carbon starvation protein A [Synergistes sp.]|nr:carbon starvation protein A [Synergistes sp.]